MKKILSLLLAAAMLLALLAGCGSSSDTSESASEAEETEEETAETAAEETDVAAIEENTEKEENTEETEEIVSSVSYPICETGDITLTYFMAWPPFLLGQYDPGEVQFFAAMEEATGISVDISFCSTEVFSDQLSLMSASNSYCDLMQGAATNYPGGGTKAIEDEMLVDLLPYMEENMPNYWAYMQDEAVSRLIINDQGYVPMLSGIYTDYYYTDQGLWVRQDWLDELGMEKPETLDEFTAMLEAFQAEMGATEALTVLSSGTLGSVGATFGSNPGGIIIVDGEATYSDITENTREYLRYMNQLYEAGLISSDFMSYTDSSTKPPEDVVLNGLTGVFNEDVASITNYTNMVEGMELTALQSPLQTSGELLDNGPYAVLVSSQYNISIATTCEYIEEALQYIDYLFTEEGMILANYGIEGITYDVIDGVYTFKDEILNDPLGFQISLSINICPGFVRMIDWDVTYLTYNEAQKEAVDIWMTAYGSSDATFPQDYVTYTTEESETISALESDISTYCEECRLKFIIGDMDLDTEWDDYVANVEAMGVAELETVYQAAYTRFLEK